MHAGGANNRDDPWVYRPGIYVRNMQRNGMYVVYLLYCYNVLKSFLLQ